MRYYFQTTAQKATKKGNKKMKMIIRMFCAVALVAGALSLTGCGDKKADDKGTNGAATSSKTQQVKTPAAPKTPEAQQGK